MFCLKTRGEEFLSPVNTNMSPNEHVQELHRFVSSCWSGNTSVYLLILVCRYSSPKKNCLPVIFKENAICCVIEKTKGDEKIGFDAIIHQEQHHYRSPQAISKDYAVCTLIVVHHLHTKQTERTKGENWTTRDTYIVLTTE